jgi:hypothetical protein
MSALGSSSDRKARALLAAIAPIAGVVFTAFFVIGLALPVLPLHVHNDRRIRGRPGCRMPVRGFARVATLGGANYRYTWT